MTPHLKGTTIVDFIFMVHTTKWIEENLQVVCSSAIVLTAEAASGGAAELAEKIYHPQFMYIRCKKSLEIPRSDGMLCAYSKALVL